MIQIILIAFLLLLLAQSKYQNEVLSEKLDDEILKNEKLSGEHKKTEIKNVEKINDESNINFENVTVEDDHDETEKRID